MLHGFILEVLSGPTWRRESQISWTRNDILDRASKRLSATSILAVRILPCLIDDSAAEQLDRLDRPQADFGSGGASSLEVAP